MNWQRQREREIQRQRERQQNHDMMTESVVLMSLWPALLTFWFQTDLGRENSASHLKIQAGKIEAFHFSHHSNALITVYHRPIFMLWLVKIWQVSSCRKFIQHLEPCLLWQLKVTELAEYFVNLWCFFTVFFHWMLKVKYSCYQQSSLIRGWFVYWIFGWEMRRLSKLEIRFRMHRFRFSPCWMPGWKVPQAILALLDRFQELHLEW